MGRGSRDEHRRDQFPTLPCEGCTGNEGRGCIVRQVDQFAKEGRRSRARTPPVALLSAGLLAIGGFAAVSSPESMAQQVEDSARSVPVQDLMTTREGPHTRMCDPHPPDFPGCTAQQLKPHSKKKTRYQLKHKWWGKYKPKHIYKDLTKKQNRRLKRRYNHLVHWYVQERLDAGYSWREAQPRFGSWRTFKLQTGCSLQPSAPWGMPTLQCDFSADSIPWGDIIDHIQRIQMGCGGMVLGYAAGGAFSGIFLTPPGVLGGAAIGAGAGEVSCLVQKAWSSVN